jgi:hypothetical protein
MKRLKGLLTGSTITQKKGKKSQDVIISSPQQPFEDDNVILRSENTSASNNISSSMEDILQATRHNHVVENDYVPEPQMSPKLGYGYLQRSNTVSVAHPSKRRPKQLRPQTASFDNSLPTQHNVEHFDHLSPHLEEEFEYNPNSERYSGQTNKHLSVVSIESGLGLTCETDEFNRTAPLESQPWFHGSIGRREAESLLDEDGDFLVHESRGNYTLSLSWEGRCYHLLINCNEIVMKGPEGIMTTGYKYQFDNGAFDSVPELIYNHLHYKIPISHDFDGTLSNPVVHLVRKSMQRELQSSQSTLKRSYGTLPKNFGRSIENISARSLISPDFMIREYDTSSLRGARAASFSPVDQIATRHKPNRNSGGGITTFDRIKTGSLNSLPNAIKDLDEDEASNFVLGSMYKDVPPSPIFEHNKSIPDEVRPRTISPYSTYDVPVSSRKLQSPVHSVDYGDRHIDPEDYEFMGSVCIRNTLPASPKSTRSSSSIQYASVTPKSIRSQMSSPAVSPSPVKYAEVTFKRSNTTTASDYTEIVGRNRSQTVTYVTPRMVREEIMAANGPTQPHPFATYSTPAPQPVVLRKDIPKSKISTSSYSTYSTRPASVIAKNAKAPKSINEVSPFLKEFTNEEIAMHLTKADAVCFLIAPRPGEDINLWKNRVQELSSESGVFVGVEILAAPSGEKLWKKLFYRHLSLSQLVAISLIHITDVIERSKMLKRWIEIADLLQSGTYGNLFSFMAIMKGLESPQVLDMKRTWEVLRTHYDSEYNLYDKTLKGMISALMEGAGVYDITQLTIPAIQHLRKLYANDTTTTKDLRCILEDFTMRMIGLDGLHVIISHSSQLSANARKRLTVYSYDALLFDFFMQDFTRIHLQNMGTSVDDPLERYRRFNIVLDALMSKIDNP